jgi:UrcA family protein
MKKLSLLGAAALGVLFAASSASAQTYNERVDVTAPRLHDEPRDSVMSATADRVSMSEAVSYRDLDLRTANGARRLEERVRFAAQNVCRRLDRLYPITEPGNPSCVQDAIQTGMERADAAVDHVRYVAYLNDRRHIAMLEKNRKMEKHVAKTEAPAKTKKHAA